MHTLEKLFALTGEDIVVNKSVFEDVIKEIKYRAVNWIGGDELLGLIWTIDGIEVVKSPEGYDTYEEFLITAHSEEDIDKAMEDGVTILIETNKIDEPMIRLEYREGRWVLLTSTASIWFE